MGDLYLDDIENQTTYTDAAVLRDIRALISAGQREGPMLDYKKDVSDKDNWPETAAAFANTFGGLIVFGVEGKADQPRQMTGFDPRGVEIKTRLASTLLSRIQPRPQFQVRVATLDTDQAKEVAILRISEGFHPPYMHSRGDEHRIYIRVGAQKTEADYLQLYALLEKRRAAESKVPVSCDDLIGGQSQLLVAEPFDSSVTSQNWYRFIIIPEDGQAARRLTGEVERQFAHCINHLYGQPECHKLVMRRQHASYFRRGTGTGGEQRFGIAATGCLGFVTHACIKTSDGPFFLPFHFCRDLIDFLLLAASHYDNCQYYGGNLLTVTLKLSETAQLYGGVPSRNSSNQGSGLFEPPLESLSKNDYTTQIHVALHPVTSERLSENLESVINDLARTAGCVLSSVFGATIKPLVEDDLKRSRVA